MVSLVGLLVMLAVAVPMTIYVYDGQSAIGAKWAAVPAETRPELGVPAEPPPERVSMHGYDDPWQPASTPARLSSAALAPNTARALPRELAAGRNAQSGVHEYHGVDAGKPVYAGITNDIARRQAQHGRSVRLDQLTPAAGVTRGQARAIEEALIVRNPGFQNLRHEISPRRSWYQDALDWGNDWLTGQGL